MFRVHGITFPENLPWLFMTCLQSVKQIFPCSEYKLADRDKQDNYPWNIKDSLQVTRSQVIQLVFFGVEFAE